MAKNNNDRYVAFAFATAEIFLELSTDGVVSYEGGAFNRLVPSGKKSLTGMKLQDLIYPADALFVDACFPRIIAKKRLGPLPIRFVGTGEQMINVRAFALQMDDGIIYMALRSALTANDSGVKDDQYDPDTGLINREGFLALASRTMKGADDSPDSHVASASSLRLSLTHIDGIEETRQKLGFEKAREVINQIAAHLRSLSVDGSMAGQINASDFAIMHQGTTSGKDIQSAISSVDETGLLKASVQTINADKGGADAAAMSEQQIIKTLSYIFGEFAKNPAKASFSSISEIYEDVAVKTKVRVAAIEKVINNRSFRLHYQPIFNLKTREVSHHEILSRFDDVIKGETTSDLIQFAEDIGLIENFDLAVFDKAFDSIESYKKLNTRLSLSINLSGRTLSSPPHMNLLMEKLERNKRFSDQVMIELTESSAVRNVDSAAELFNAIRAMGFSISIDDFGKGAAGLNYLRAFNVDYVKIDGAFVRDLTRAEPRPGMLLSIVRLCHDLDVKIIAEHVEERFQADILRSLDVDLGQGYHFAKPQSNPVTD